MKFVFVKNHLEGLEPSFYSSLGNTLLSNLQFTRFKQLRKSFLKTPEANHITPEMSSFIQSLQRYQPAHSSREGDEAQPSPTTALISIRQPRAGGNYRARRGACRSAATALWSDTCSSQSFHIPTAMSKSKQTQNPEACQRHQSPLTTFTAFLRIPQLL